MARPSYYISITRGDAETVALGFLVKIKGRETFIEMDLPAADVAKLAEDISTHRRLCPLPSEN